MRARRFRHFRVAFLITAAVLAVLTTGFGWSFTEALFAKLRYTACDNLLFGARGALPTPPDIVLVAIDSPSVKELGNWPFPREWHAEVIRRLDSWGAKVIAFDVVMDQEKDPEGDRALVEACRQAGNVITAANLDTITDEVRGTSLMQWQYPFEALSEVSDVGTASFSRAEDQAVRWADVYSAEVAGLRLPLLSVLAAARYLEDSIPTSEALAGEPLRLGPSEIPLNDRGQFWINYIGPPGHVKTISYYQVLQGLVPPETFKNRLVFVGATDPLLHDDATTPFGPKYPGVEVHTSIANMLLRNQPLYLPADWTALLLAAIASLCISFLTVAGRPIRALGQLAVGSAAYLFVASFLFRRYGIWIPMVVPLLGAALAYVGGVLYKFLVEERERRRISTLFSKYVSKDVARELMEDEATAQLGSSRKLPVTCLFSDIRGFTSMSESLSPEEVVAMLNEYFDRMVHCVFENRGTLDKYVGDAIMATYGVPKSFGNDAERACRTAVRMREELLALQAKWAAEGRRGIDIGIGINSGDAVVGNIGHRDRMEFTCIGDTINTASRLESLNKDLGTKILISESTYQLIAETGLFDVKKLPPAMVKGKAEAIQVYELLGWSSERPAAAPVEEAAAAR